MGKLGLFVVALALLATARCYNADLVGAMAGMPVVGAMVSPPTPPPKYITVIGTPAPSKLPEIDFKTWFPTDPAVDPYAVATWTAIAQFVETAGTQAGWTEACKKAGAAAGNDRSANPLLGVLGCSSDATVTQLQQFALHVLAARAAVALWVKGAPGGSAGAIEGRQGEVRLLCGVDVVSRQGGPTSVFAQACTKALDTSYRTGDATATFAALGEAYSLVATEIAKRDPTVDPEPGYFGAPEKKN